MTVASVPFKLTNTIAITYQCSKGHHIVRYWRTPCRIHREVRCDVCKDIADIPAAEHKRHALLRDGLDQWLDGPPPYQVIHRSGN